MNEIKNIVRKYQEIIRYLFSGVLTTIVSISSYMILRFFGIHYIVSTILSWICAVLFAYFINKFYVFQSGKSKEDTTQFFKFVFFRLLSLGIELVAMVIMVDFLKIHDGIAKILVQGIVLILNYLFSKLFIFTKK